MMRFQLSGRGKWTVSMLHDDKDKSMEVVLRTVFVVLNTDRHWTLRHPWSVIFVICHFPLDIGKPGDVLFHPPK